MSKTIRCAVILAAVCLLMSAAGHANAAPTAAAQAVAPTPPAPAASSLPTERCPQPAAPWHPLTACNMISCTPGITNCTQLCGDDAICVAEVGSPAHHCLFH